MIRDPAAPPLPAIPGVPERVADHLTEMIIRGELAPGDRIPESRITVSLGVSRGSVREALQILVRRHLVRLQPRRGATVTELDETVTSDLYEMLISLYTALAQLAARRWRTEAELAPLQALVAEMRVCARRGDALAVIELSATFTEAGCELVANGFLTAALRDLRPVFNRGYYRLLARGQTEFELLCEFVAALVEQIRSRDPEALARTVRDYGEHQRDQILNTF